MKKTRRKRKRQKNRKWDLKSGLNGRYNNGDKKVSFFLKETNERNEKERKVLWEEKENDERERGPEIKRTELRQRWLFLQKRDQNKGIKTKESKQGVEKTGKRHTLKGRRFWKDDVHKKHVNNKKKNKRERKDRKTQKKKKGTREKQKVWQVFTKRVQK